MYLSCSSRKCRSRGSVPTHARQQSYPLTRYKPILVLLNLILTFKLCYLIFNSSTQENKMADSVTLFDGYMPYLFHSLDTFDAILTKAKEHAKEKGIDVDEEFVKASLIEDMYSLAGQIRVATNIISYFAFPVTGVALPEFPGDDKTFQEMYARIQKTRELLQTVKPAHFQGRAEEVIEL